MRAKRKIAGALLLTTCLWPVAHTLAQEQDAEEKSGLIKFVEEQLSSPTRQISLNGIKGTLSSDVSFDSITISDENGVWLTIVNPRLQWTRSALLGGRLEIQSLTADRIDWPRMPAADTSVPSPESSGFRVPDLPVSVNIGEIAVPEAEFGQPVFGLASTLSLDGNLTIGDGDLATELAVRRLDGPGGQLALDAQFANSTSQLDVNLSLQEPQDGVVANLLNIPGRPPVSLTVTGAGPLDDFDAQLAFDVDGRSVATGSFSLNDGILSNDRRADLRLTGPISSILPEEHRAFFGAETTLTADAILKAAGGMELRSFTLDSGVLQLKASATTLADWFPSSLTVDATMQSADGTPVRLPTSGEPVMIGDGTLALRYGGSDWTLATALNRVSTAKADINAVTLNGSGTVTELRKPANRALTFDFAGAAKGIAPEDPGVARAVGDAIDFSTAGTWSGSATTLDRVSLTGDTLSVTANGTIEDFAFKGNAQVESSDLSAFSLAADRSLTGAAALSLDGSVGLAGGAFDLTFDGTLTDATFDSPTADRLLAGETKLTGSAARTPDGLSFRALNVKNDRASALIDGDFASAGANLKAHAEIFDLATIDDRGSGRLTLDAAIDKPEGSAKDAPYAVSATLGLADGRLVGRAVPQARLGFDGSIQGSDLSGSISGTGQIGGETIDIAGALDKTDETLSLSDFAARIGLSAITGNVTVANGLADGNLAIASRDIAPIAALALADASGAVDGTVQLSAANGAQDIDADITVSDARYEKTKIGGARIEADVRDLKGSPKIDARIDGRAIEAGGISIATLKATSETTGDTTRFAADASLDNGTTVTAGGSLETTDDGFDATIETLAAQSRYGDVRLTAPARISRDGDVTRIDTLQANVAGGRVTASGSVGETISLKASIAALPLSIANGFRSDLGLGGTLDGTVDVTGPASDPQVAFSANSSGLDAATLRSASVSPINASAAGIYRSGTVRLTQMSARNAQDLDFSGSGTIPLSGSGLSLRIAGTAPLAFAERFLADRGTTLGGTLRVDATVSGSLSAPQAEGLFSVSGGTVSDPLSNLRLTQLGGVAGLRGDTISISKFTGQLAGGGSVSIGGTVGLSGSLPANLTITLSNAVYSDGETIRTTLSGNLAVSGALTAGPLVSGTINLNNTEITVPETIGNETDLLEVKHVDPDRGTLQTLRRIQAVLPKSSGSAPSAPVRLDVTINSPNQIFVRGRGIDAELGGSLRVVGALDALQPVGAFRLIRGRLSILSKRLNLTEGSITLTGSLDPMIDLTAQVNGDDIIAYVTLSGRASDLSLDLSASPELPEDEILARVLFGKGISSLSPIQIANLATAAASLASGGSGAGLSEQIRRGVGVDDLDIVQDSEGNVAVKAGKYIQDNVYLDIQAGQSGGEVSINLDVTDSLTAKGTVDSEGDSKLGIFFEKDY